MEKINIGLKDDALSGVSEILNKILSNEYVLYTKTRNFHWNIKAPHFNDLHKFFEGQYEELDESIDEIAERIRMLGNFPIASLEGFKENSSIGEVDSILESKDMIATLLADHETLIREIRTSIKHVSKYEDFGSEDFLIALLQKHEKMAWMLRSMQ